MVDWSDPRETARDSDVFLKLIFSLFGVYVWELFMTCDFEWSLVTRKRSFRWPLVIFFFFCRYCMLFALVGLIISLSITTRALYTFNSWTGNMAILCASTSLMLRTIALWERKKVIIFILGFFCLAHWALLYRTMFIVTAEWRDDVKACVVTQTFPSLLNSTFFYTMAFDFIILVFTARALIAKHSFRTDLWRLLFQDGLVYFLISFSTNCIPAVLNVLNLNTPMNVSIAACRAVIRLLEFSANDVYIHSLSAVTGSIGVRQSIAPYVLPRAPKYALTRPEVHVTTEHIMMAEISPSTTESPYSKIVVDERDEPSSIDIPSAQDIDGFFEQEKKTDHLPRAI
ncbi:hypothetical protein AMATHDRAFT_74138 [Amanita thiersii Skay4041]|uniref:Uncharacterized protein n=1 Tax=Amanita thiersii Skay4041 TaxID=703135 RepID=A0A2A9NWF5_9AGAR|nr:hypothetical protein AMATHDRAFT_74138 [Amanita thiersii Skay4041]